MAPSPTRATPPNTPASRPPSADAARAATRHITATISAVTIVDDFVRVRGGVVHLEWSGKVDGGDYPVEGVEVYLTSAYHLVDDHTLELTQKLDGRVVVRARLVLSADGKTITTTTSDGVTTATTVYSKRSS